MRRVRNRQYGVAMRLIVARCAVDYTGRLTAHLPEALRLIMVKADGSVLVHADAGGYKPLNWMTPPTVIEEEDGRIVVRKLKGDDQLEITLSEVLSDVEHEMDFDAARLEKDGVEAHLQVALADAPEWCGEGFRLVRREWPTDIGPVDLMCRDADDGWIAVEIKRIGTIDAVEQLSRYLERIRLDPALADCRGVLAAHDRQAAGARARRGARDRVGRGRPRGAARRARARADAVRMSVGVEARDGVLVITIDRPQARNAIDASGRGGDRGGAGPARRRRRARGRRDHRRRRLLLRRHGPQGVRGRAAVARRRARLRRDRRAPARHAADRRDRGLRRGRRARGRARVRPDRRRPRRQARHPRGQALARRVRRRRCCACRRRIPYHVAMELALTGDPIERRARPRAGPRQPPRRAGRRARRRARAGGGDHAERPARPRGDQAHPARGARLAGRRGVGRASRRSPARSFASEDAREGAVAFAEKRAPVWRGR